MGERVAILGHGVAGCLLARALERRGLAPTVYDDPDGGAASRLAAGLMNPLAGRTLQPAPGWARFRPAAEAAYRDLDRLLGLRSFHPTDFVTLLRDDADAERWAAAGRDAGRAAFLPGSPSPVPAGLRAERGHVRVTGGARVDLAPLLDAHRRHLLAAGRWRGERRDPAALRREGGAWRWGDAVHDHVVFCQGAAAAGNPWCAFLPLRPNRGERLLLERDGPAEAVYRKTGLLAPAADGAWWLGSANAWTPDARPSAEGRSRLEALATGFFQTPPAVRHHGAALRPTLADRKPAVGPHPDAPGLWLFNGLGTKGALWAPWHAERLADALTGRGRLDPATLPDRFGSAAGGPR